MVVRYGCNFFFPDCMALNSNRMTLIIIVIGAVALIIFVTVKTGLWQQFAQKPEAGSVAEMLGSKQTDIDTANDAGVAFAEKDELDKARESFMRALMFDPGYPPTLSNLCALSIDEGKLDEAIEYCTNALDRGSKFSDAQYNLATAYFKKNDLKNATIYADMAEKNGRDVTQLRTAIAAKTTK